MQEWLVYALKDPSGRMFYIGATCKPKRRLKEHRTVHGQQTEMITLESGFQSAGACGEAERRHIAQARSNGLDILNVSNGGFVGKVHRESTRRKLSAAFKGRRITWAEKISASGKGKKRNWSDEGRKAVERSQFKRGEKPRNDSERKKKQAEYLDSLTFDQRSAMSIKANKGWWAKATPEERAERTRNMTSARDNSKISERMKVVAAKRIADPNARKAFGERIKNFWANMTQEERADYLRRRGEAIAAAKAAKKKNDQSAAPSRTP